MTGANGIQWPAAKAGQALQAGAKASRAGGKKSPLNFAAMMSAGYAAGADTAVRTPSYTVPKESAYESYPGVGREIAAVKDSPMSDKLGGASGELEGFVKEVTAAVAKELGVDEEQVTLVMEELSLSAFDLLNPQNLTKLAMELTGAADETELLLSPRFLDLMQTVQTMGRELLTELDLSPEQVDELIAQAKELIEQTRTPEASEEFPTEDFSQENAQEPNELPKTEVSAGSETAQGPEGTVENAQAQPTENANANEKTAGEDTVLAKGDSEEAAAVQEPKDGEAAVKTTAETKTVDVQEEPDAQEEEPVKNTELKPVQTKESEEQSADAFGKEKERGEESFAGARRSGADTQAAAIHEPAAGVQSAISEAIGEMPAADNVYVSAETIDMIEQVAEKLKVTISEGLSSMEMTLNPENLGKVYLQITSREGAVHAQIAAANEAVKNALESQVAQIQENLNQAGVKVEAIEVTVASHEFERNLEQNQKREEQEGERAQERAGHRRNLNLSSLDELSGMMSEEEALVAQMMRDNGNTVDLSA